jgi:hypothetical protein
MADVKVKVSFDGVVHNTEDAHRLIQAVRLRLIPRVRRRLNDLERHAIRSGSVFVYESNESNIKRWTDGLSWKKINTGGDFMVRAMIV